MSNLGQRFLELGSARKRAVHFKLCAHALGKWLDYSASRGRIEYIEGVVGTSQVVDNDLPALAFEAARQGRDTNAVARRYGEPIAALQDEDLAFPDQVAYAYYAVYNLFRKYAGSVEIDDWLIVNQALSSETDASKWPVLLREAIDETVALL